ncbi:MAG: hypothetical protein IKL75_01585 [Bacteroidaceae bacterium]|nr:hypothetical protein [Bacteroidaceae bacterium]
MDDYGFSEMMQQRYKNAIAREKRRVQEARHKTNVAAVLDFTSTLMSMLGRNIGARYPLSTNLMSEYHRQYGNAKDRYNAMLVDYNGFVANEKLRQGLGAGSAITGTELQNPESSRIDSGNL